MSFEPLMDKIVCAGTAADPSSAVYHFGGWVGVAVMAMLASLAILAILYMFAAFFQNQGFIALVKVEMYELLVTFLIFAFMFSLVGGFCGAKTGWIFPDAHRTFHFPGGEWNTESLAGKSFYYSAANYLNDFADYTIEVMALQYVVYMYVDFLTSSEIVAVPMGVGANLKPTAGLGAAVKPVLNNAFTVETIAAITARAQVWVLDFATYGLLTYFLPLAFILRSFAYTRRIGGTIIAITCVFLFLYPLLIIPSYMIVNEPLQGRLNWIADFISQNGGAAQFSFFMLLQFLLKWLWGPSFLMTYALLAIPTTAAIFIGGVFMPLFNTIILATAARYLSKLLGEEIDITNLTRMI